MFCAPLEIAEELPPHAILPWVSLSSLYQIKETDTFSNEAPILQMRQPRDL
jgi:hypothetical protein